MENEKKNEEKIEKKKQEKIQKKNMKEKEIKVKTPLTKADKQKNLQIVKTCISWVIIVLCEITLALYLILGWKEIVYDFSAKLNGVIESLFILLSAYLLMKLSKLLFGLLTKKSSKSQTAIKLLASVIKYIIGIVAVMLVIGRFVADTSALLTSLSMLTLVVGLGAQSLISDIIAGMFIVFEGDFKVGDVVVIDGWRGVVNEIGIRNTKIEDAGGNIQIINNSKISKIINNSKTLSIAICDIGIEYGESLERVENIISNNLNLIKEKIPAIVEGPFYKGVDSLGDSAVMLKIVAKCAENDKFQVQRDLNRQLKLIFDKNNIGIPFPQVTLSYLPETEVVKVSKQAQNKAENFVEDQKELSKHINEENNN